MLLNGDFHLEIANLKEIINYKMDQQNYKHLNLVKKIKRKRKLKNDNN